MTALVGSIQIARDTAANWTAANTILKDGQQGYETDTNRLKIGDGSTVWASLAYWKEPIAGIWSAIKALKDASSLIPGQFYRITDFATVHNIPNVSPTTTFTGATEELTLLALSVNTFHAQAFSEDFPQDIIHYELTDTSTAGGTKGRIYYRRDNLLKIETWYDWRNVKFRRWETSLGSGVYTRVTDPGGGVASRDRYTFNDSAAATNCSDVSIGRQSATDQLNNILFTTTAVRITLQANCKNITAVGGCNNLTMDMGCENITFSNSVGATNGGGASFGRFCGSNGGSITIGTQLGHSRGFAKFGDWVAATNGVLTVGIQFGGNTGFASVGSHTAYNGGNVTIGDQCGTGAGSALIIGAQYGRAATVTIANSVGSGTTIIIGDNQSVSIPTYSALSGKIERGFSSFVDTAVGLTAASTTLDFTAARAYVGDATLTAAAANESLNTINNLPTNHPVIFRPESGLIVTFVTATGNLRLAGGANFVADGTKGDYIILERRADGNIYQIGGVNY